MKERELDCVCVVTLAAAAVAAAYPLCRRKQARGHREEDEGQFAFLNFQARFPLAQKLFKVSGPSGSFFFRVSPSSLSLKLASSLTPTTTTTTPEADKCSVSNCFQVSNLEPERDSSSSSRDRKRNRKRGNTIERSLSWRLGANCQLKIACEFQHTQAAAAGTTWLEVAQRQRKLEWQLLRLRFDVSQSASQCQPELVCAICNYKPPL